MKAVLEIVTFNVNDVVTTSGNCSDEGTEL